MTGSSKGAGCSGIANFAENVSIKQRDPNSLLPLIILSRGLNQKPDWQAWQAELLQLSTNSDQLIADKSGHNIEIDQPQAVIDSVTKMVEQIRQQKKQSIRR